MASSQYLSELGIDVGPIYDLGNAWIAFGDTLWDQANAAATAYSGTGAAWHGDAAGAADAAMLTVNSALVSSIDPVWKIGEAINAYADELVATEKEIEKEMMAEMLAAIFGAVLGFIPGLGAILQSVLKWAAALIEWAVTVFAQVLSKMGSIAGRIAFAATSAIAAGAVQLGEDLLSQEIANAIVGLPDLKVDWKGEAISTALGAGAGGVGGWVHFPKIADKPAPKFPNSLTGKVGGDTGLPGINVNPKLGSPGDTSVTASSITPPAGAANVGAVKVNRLASGGTEATALPPAVETRLAPATSDGGALPATKTVAQPPAGLRTNVNTADGLGRSATPPATARPTASNPVGAGRGDAAALPPGAARGETVTPSGAGHGDVATTPPGARTEVAAPPGASARGAAAATPSGARTDVAAPPTGSVRGADAGTPPAVVRSGGGAAPGDAAHGDGAVAVAQTHAEVTAPPDGTARGADASVPPTGSARGPDVGVPPVSSHSGGDAAGNAARGDGAVGPTQTRTTEVTAPPSGSARGADAGAPPVSSRSGGAVPGGTAHGDGAQTRTETGASGGTAHGAAEPKGERAGTPEGNSAQHDPAISASGGARSAGADARGAVPGSGAEARGASAQDVGAHGSGGSRDQVQGGSPRQTGERTAVRQTHESTPNGTGTREGTGTRDGTGTAEGDARRAAQNRVDSAQTKVDAAEKNVVAREADHAKAEQTARSAHAKQNEAKAANNSRARAQAAADAKKADEDVAKATHDKWTADVAHNKAKAELSVARKADAKLTADVKARAEYEAIKAAGPGRSAKAVENADNVEKAMGVRARDTAPVDARTAPSRADALAAEKQAQTSRADFDQAGKDHVVAEAKANSAKSADAPDAKAKSAAADRAEADVVQKADQSRSARHEWRQAEAQHRADRAQVEKELHPDAGTKDPADPRAFTRKDAKPNADKLNKAAGVRTRAAKPVESKVASSRADALAAEKHAQVKRAEFDRADTEHRVAEAKANNAKSADAPDAKAKSADAERAGAHATRKADESRTARRDWEQAEAKLRADRAQVEKDLKSAAGVKDPADPRAFTRKDAKANADRLQTTADASGRARAADPVETRVASSRADVLVAEHDVQAKQAAFDKAHHDTMSAHAKVQTAAEADVKARTADAHQAAAHEAKAAEELRQAKHLHLRADEKLRAHRAEVEKELKPARESNTDVQQANADRFQQTIDNRARDAAPETPEVSSAHANVSAAERNVVADKAAFKHAQNVSTSAHAKADGANAAAERAAKDARTADADRATAYSKYDAADKAGSPQTMGEYLRAEAKAQDSAAAHPAAQTRADATAADAEKANAAAKKANADATKAAADLRDRQKQLSDAEKHLASVTKADENAKAGADGAPPAKPFAAKVRATPKPGISFKDAKGALADAAAKPEPDKFSSEGRRIGDPEETVEPVPSEVHGGAASGTRTEPGGEAGTASTAGSDTFPGTGWRPDGKTPQPQVKAVTGKFPGSGERVDGGTPQPAAPADAGAKAGSGESPGPGQHIRAEEIAGPGAQGEPGGGEVRTEPGGGSSDGSSAATAGHGSGSDADAAPGGEARGVSGEHGTGDSSDSGSSGNSSTAGDGSGHDTDTTAKAEPDKFPGAGQRINGEKVEAEPQAGPDAGDRAQSASADTSTPGASGNRIATVKDLHGDSGPSTGSGSGSGESKGSGGGGAATHQRGGGSATATTRDTRHDAGGGGKPEKDKFPGTGRQMAEEKTTTEVKTADTEVVDPETAQAVPARTEEKPAAPTDPKPDTGTGTAKFPGPGERAGGTTTTPEDPAKAAGEAALARADGHAGTAAKPSEPTRTADPANAAGETAGARPETRTVPDAKPSEATRVADRADSATATDAATATRTTAGAKPSEPTPAADRTDPVTDAPAHRTDPVPAHPEPAATAPVMPGAAHGTGPGPIVAAAGPAGTVPMPPVARPTINLPPVAASSAAAGPAVVGGIDPRSDAGAQAQPVRQPRPDTAAPGRTQAAPTERLTDEQRVGLTRLTRYATDEPVGGLTVFHALAGVVPGSGTPESVRAQLADVLRADLDRAPRSRLYWPKLDGLLKQHHHSAVVTDYARQDAVQALRQGGQDDQHDVVTDAIALATAQRVWRIGVVEPDGSLNTGTGAGDVPDPQAVLVRLAGSDGQPQWLPTRSVATDTTVAMDAEAVAPAVPAPATAPRRQSFFDAPRSAGRRPAAGGRRSLTAEEDLYQEVRSQLRSIPGARSLTGPEAERIRQRLMAKGRLRGRITTRALATDIVADHLGLELPRLRGAGQDGVADAVRRSGGPSDEPVTMPANEGEVPEQPRQPVVTGDEHNEAVGDRAVEPPQARRKGTQRDPAQPHDDLELQLRALLEVARQASTDADAVLTLATKDVTRLENHYQGYQGSNGAMGSFGAPAVLKAARARYEVAREEVLEANYLVEDLETALDEHLAGWGADAPAETTADSRPRLSDVLPESEWWRLFLDPLDHGTAQAKHPEDPGSYYDNDQSPGFRAGMVAAYHALLDDPEKSLDFESYSALHAMVVSSLAVQPKPTGVAEWEPTLFPLRADTVSDSTDILTVGGRKLLYDFKRGNFQDAVKAKPIAFVHATITEKYGKSVVTSNYVHYERPGIISAVFSEYASEISESRTDDDRLAAIARTITKLQIIHAFADGNRRLNVHVVLPKLLLENNFQPVVSVDMRRMFQGGTDLEQQVRILRESQLASAAGEAPSLTEAESPVTPEPEAAGPEPEAPAHAPAAVLNAAAPDTAPRDPEPALNPHSGRRDRRGLRAAKVDGTLHERRPRPRPVRAENNAKAPAGPVQAAERKAVAEQFAKALAEEGYRIFLSGGAALGWQGGRRPVGDLDFRVRAEDVGFDDFDQPGGELMTEYLNTVLAARVRHDYQTQRKQAPDATPHGGKVDVFQPIGAGNALTIGTGDWLGHEISVSLVRGSPRATVELAPGLRGLTLEELRADKANALITRKKRDEVSVKKVAQDVFDFLDTTRLIDVHDTGPGMARHIDEALPARAEDYAASNLDGMRLHHLSPEALRSLMRTRLILTARTHLSHGPRGARFRKLLADTAERPGADVTKDPLYKRLQAVAALDVPAEDVKALRPWFAAWNDTLSHGPRAGSHWTKRRGVNVRAQGDRSTEPPVLPPDDREPQAPVEDLWDEEKQDNGEFIVWIGEDLKLADIHQALLRKLPKASALARQVMQILVMSGGFRRLEDHTRHTQTIEAFGLSRTQFRSALSELMAAGLVVPHHRGLFLTGMDVASSGVPVPDAVRLLRAAVRDETDEATESATESATGPTQPAGSSQLLSSGESTPLSSATDSDEVEAEDHDQDQDQEPDPALLDVLEALERLWAGDPRNSDQPLDPGQLAVRVLRLDPTAEPDIASEYEVLRLVAELGPDRTDGPMASLDALAEHYLQQETAGNGRRIMLSDDERGGRDWSLEGLDGPLTLDSVTIPRHRAKNEPESETEVSAPWIWTSGGETPYPVVANIGPADTVVVYGHSGAELNLTAEEFAELTASDPALAELPQNAPILLVGAYLGADVLRMPRILARRTGRDVWSHTGPVEIRYSDTEDSNFIAPGYGDDKVVGQWVVSHPGDLDAAPAGGPGTFIAYDKKGNRLEVPDSDVVFHTIVDNSGRQLGRAAHTVEDWARRERAYANFPAITTYGQKGPDRRPVPGSERDLPWIGGPEPYVFNSHAMPKAVQIPLRDGRTVFARGAEAAKLLRRRPSLSALPKDRPVVAWMCEGGSVPEDEDVLSSISHGQALANELGRVVYAATGVVNTKLLPSAALPDGIAGVSWTPVTWLVAKDPTKGARLWLKFEPEPDDARLDELAHFAGLHGTDSPQGVRQLALQLFRIARAAELNSGTAEAQLQVPGLESVMEPAPPQGTVPNLMSTLGLLLGLDVVETEPDGLEAVMRSLGSLEQMRHRDPAYQQLFTMKQLDEIVAQHFASSDQPTEAGVVDRSGYQEMLRQAMPVLGRPPYATLSKFLAAASAQKAAAAAASTSGTGPQPAGTVDDPVDESADAALAEQGDSRRLQVAVGDTVIDGAGQDWGRNQLRAPLVVDEIRIPRHRRKHDPETEVQVVAPWMAGGRTPYPVVVEAGPAGTVTVYGTSEPNLHLPELHLNAEEFADLVAADPALAQTAPDAPILLAGSRLGEGVLEVPRTLARRTGREVWSHTGRVAIRLTETGASHYLAPGPAKGRAAGQWVVSHPGDLDAAPAGGPGVFSAVDATGRRVEVRDSDVLFHTIVDHEGHQLGRATHTVKDWAKRERPMSNFPAMTRYEQRERIGLPPVPGSSRALPWSGGPEPYVFDAHADPRIVEIALKDGTKVLAPTREVAGLLRRRPSLSALPKDRPVVAWICEGGTVPEGQDIVSAVSHGQGLANLLGRDVYAATGKVHSKSFPTEQLPDGIAGVAWTPGAWLIPADGTRGVRLWLKFEPDPDNRRLDELARLAGLRGNELALPLTRGIALRLYRIARAIEQMAPASEPTSGPGTVPRLFTTLRRLMGRADVNSAPDRLEAVMRSLGSLERMRQQDPAYREPFTMAQLDRIVADHFTDHQDLLRQAAPVLGRPPVGTLTKFLRAADAKKRRRAAPPVAPYTGAESPDPADDIEESTTGDKANGNGKQRSLAQPADDLELELRAALAEARQAAADAAEAYTTATAAVTKLEAHYTGSAAGSSSGAPAALTAARTRYRAAEAAAHAATDLVRDLETALNHHLAAQLWADVPQGGTGGRNGTAALSPAPTPRPEPEPAPHPAPPATPARSTTATATIQFAEHQSKTLTRDQKRGIRALAEHTARAVTADAARGGGPRRPKIIVTAGGNGSTNPFADRDRLAWQTGNNRAQLVADTFRTEFDRALRARQEAAGTHFVIDASSVEIRSRGRGLPPEALAAPGHPEKSVLRRQALINVEFAPRPQPQPQPNAAPAKPTPRVRFAPDPLTERAGGTAPGTARSTESDLDRRRPTRVVRDIPPPSRQQTPPEFTDGAKLPPYVNGVAAAHPDGADSGLRGGTYGHARTRLRGAEKVVQEIGWQLAGMAPAERGRSGLLARVEHAIRFEPESFTGEDGRMFTYQDNHNRAQEIKVTARHYGKWERFADDAGAPVKYLNVHRGQLGSGSSKSVTSNAVIAPSTGLGPHSGLSALGRLGLRLGRTVGTSYTMVEQVMNHAESRSQENSHLHLDDVYYTIEPVAGVEPPTPFGFAVRHGLTLRLMDSATKPATSTRPTDASRPGRAVDEIRLGPESSYRMVHSEGFGPVDNMLDWAVRRAGARPQDSAYGTLSGFFSSRNMHRMAELLAHSPVPGPPLFADDSTSTPLGSFLVERTVPGRAIRLSETTAMEMRHSVQLTVRNELARFKSLTAGANAAVGPSLDVLGFFDHHAGLRLQLAASADYAFSADRTANLGGSGTMRTLGRVKGVPTDLYLVEKTVYVRWTGDDEAVPFRTWSLDRMTREEARRLAGWDDGTALRVRTGAEPLPAPYLTQNHPPTLGLNRIEDFTFEDGSAVREVDGRSRTLPEVFTDQVLDAVAAKYPGTVARMAELGDPTSPRWRDLDQYRMVLANTMSIVTAISRHSMTQSLPAMTTVGYRIGLMEQGRFRRHYRYVWLSAELTDRRYEGTTPSFAVRNYMTGTERMGQQSGTSRTLTTGVDLSAAARGTAKSEVTHAPVDSGNALLGWRRAWRTRRTTGADVRLVNEPMGTVAGPSHLYSYRLSLVAHTGGYGRIRGLFRQLSVGLLGLGTFVSRDPAADVVGGTAGEPLTGRVVLAVPAAHSPERDPRTGEPSAAAQAAAERFRTFGESIQVEEMTPEEARALANGAPSTARTAPTGTVQTGTAQTTPTAPTDDDEHTRLQRQPVQTVAVLTDTALMRAAEETMAEASSGSWHFAQTGVPAHDAMLRPFHPAFWTAHHDQASGPLGTRLTGLFGKGPYRGHWAAMVVRTRLRNLTVLGDPIPAYYEQVLSVDIAASGGVLHRFQSTFGGALTYTRFHDTGHTLTGTYGALLRLSRSRETGRVVTRAVNRATSLDFNGPQYLISADMVVEIVSSARWTALAGLLRSRRLGLDAPSGRRLQLPAGYLGHLPEPSAYRLGLVHDGLGDVPEHTEPAWEIPQWLRANLFGTHPVNSLDTSALLERFLAELRRLGFAKEDLDTVRTALTPRAVRALLMEMSDTGVTLSGRGAVLHQWQLTVGGRRMTVRMELTAQQHQFEGLRHSMDVEDWRNTIETTSEARSTTRRVEAGVSVSDAVTVRQHDVSSAGPTLSDIGYGEQRRGTTESSTRTTLEYTWDTKGHAEYAIDYTLKLTVEADGQDGPVAEVAGDAGTLQQIMPLSLTRPVTEGVHPLLRPPNPPLPEARHQVWAPERVTDEELDNWRRGGTANGTEPPALPPEDFAVRYVIGLANIHAAADLTIGGAHSAGARARGTLDGDDLTRALRAARATDLTRTGSSASQALHNGTGNAALSGFYADTLTPDGYQVPGITTQSPWGGADADHRLYSRPDFGAATLLAVEPTALFWTIEENGQSIENSVTRSDGQDTILGTNPSIASDPLGAAAPALGGTGIQTSDGEGRRNVQGSVGRAATLQDASQLFLFWIPTRWLSVAGVRHYIHDSGIGKAVRTPFGDITTVPVVAETDAPVLAWVREHTARDLGLLTDDTFPPELRRTWQETEAAVTGWMDSATKYWDVRRPARKLLAELEEARAALAALAEPVRAAGAEAPRAVGDEAVQAAPSLAAAAPAAAGNDHRPQAVVAAEERVRAAQSAYDTAADAVAVARRAADDAAAELHRVRSGADQLTRWHQLPPAVRSDVPRPEPVTYQRPEQPPAKPEPAARPAYTLDGDDQERLLAPDGTAYRLDDVPSDGRSFIHALAATTGASPDFLRDRLATALRDPANADLAAFAAPDESDRFTPDELAGSGIDLGENTPARREFDALQAMPYVADLTAEERIRLAETQLRRPADADSGSGWDHSAADLLPALAARELDLRVRIVRPDGSYQEYAPPTGAAEAPLVVLRLADRHFRPAMPEDSPPLHTPAQAPAPTHPEPQVPTTERLPAHATPPWAVTDPGRYDTSDPERLTAPDGQTYLLQPATGRGNGFLGALALSLDEQSRTRLARMTDPDLYGTPYLPPDLVLDPRAVFHRDDLEAAGVHLTPDQQTAHRGNGGRLPDGITLDPAQRRGLTLSDVLSGNGWSLRTTELVARHLANWLGIDLTLVAENGTTLLTAGTPPRPRVVLYQRGVDWVAALPLPVPRTGTITVEHPSDR